MNGLGLDAAALDARRGYVQAGDAARIMAGEWRQVWREKMGLAAGDDLSGEFRVQLGSFTEPFNLAWCQRRTGRPVTYYSGNPLMREAWRALTGRDAEARELQVSADLPFMACNLDGLSTTPQGQPCVLDAKHVGVANDPMILRYTPAGVHQATVMGTDWWALSVIAGNKFLDPIYQEVDPLYQAALVAKERAFWGYVERGEEPPDETPAVAPPKPQPRLRIVQLEDAYKDAWPNWGADFVKLVYDFAGTERAAKKHAITREAMKELVPDDVGEVLRGRFRLHRTRAGAVTMAIKGDGDANE